MTAEFIQSAILIGMLFAVGAIAYNAGYTQCRKDMGKADFSLTNQPDLKEPK